MYAGSKGKPAFSTSSVDSGRFIRERERPVAAREISFSALVVLPSARPDGSLRVPDGLFLLCSETHRFPSILIGSRSRALLFFSSRLFLAAVYAGTFDKGAAKGLAGLRVYKVGLARRARAIIFPTN